MKFFFSIILLVICQCFLNQIMLDARPAKLKKFSWVFPIHHEHEDGTFHQLTKRRGAGWGKRSDFSLDDYPYAVHEDTARFWLDDK